MSRLPPLGSLRAFEAAARHTSFRRAAEELGVTPTAISHQIRLLEADIGKPLFVRQARSVTLTPEGERLATKLSEAFRSMAEGVAAARSPVHQRIATLSATSAFTGRLLVPRVAQFETVCPGWSLRLVATDDLVDLSAGEADAAIRYGSGPYPGLDVIPLIADRFAPVCAPGLGLQTVEQLSRATLIHFDWTRAANANTLPTWRRWLAQAGVAHLDPDGGIVFSDESAAIRAVAAGQGVGLLSLALVEAELSAGTLVQPFGPELEGRRYDLVFPADAQNRPAIRALRDWIACLYPQTLGREP